MDVQITTVEPLPGYRLRLGLSDGRTVERDLTHLLPGPDASPDNVFRPWLDPAYFAQVQLAEYGTAVWPNGVDLDPDVLIWGVDADGNLLRPVAATTRQQRRQAIDQLLDSAMILLEAARQRLADLETADQADAAEPVPTAEVTR